MPSSIWFHAILMHDGVYCGPLYSALKGKLCYNYAHSIIHHNIVVSLEGCKRRQPIATLGKDGWGCPLQSSFFYLLHTEGLSIVMTKGHDHHFSNYLII